MARRLRAATRQLKKRRRGVASECLHRPARCEGRGWWMDGCGSGEHVVNALGRHGGPARCCRAAADFQPAAIMTEYSVPISISKYFLQQIQDILLVDW